MSSKQEHNNQKKGIWWVFPLLLMLAMLWFWQSGPTKVSKKESKKYQKALQVGRLDACAKNPSFPAKEGLKPPFFIDLRQVDGPGLKIIEAQKGGKVLKNNEWAKAGTLGPYTLDKNGVIYTAPIPFVNLRDRPMSIYNQVFRVDNESGAMTEFLHLPPAAEPTPENAYGVVGMTYDCSNHSMYVSSLAGSGAESEVGRVFHIDLKTKKILHQLEGFDALGIGLFNMKSGKKLFLGHARSPEIFSIALDDAGGFIGKPKFEFSLAAMEGGSYDNAHRIRFLRDNVLKIKGIEFSFSLITASEPQRNIYLFDYEPLTDSWRFREAYAQ